MASLCGPGNWRISNGTQRVEDTMYSFSVSSVSRNHGRLRSVGGVSRALQKVSHYTREPVNQAWNQDESNGIACVSGLVCIFMAFSRISVNTIFQCRGRYNWLSYFFTLSYPQIQGDDPVHTSLETLPFAIMVFAANIVAGWLLGTMVFVLTSSEVTTLISRMMYAAPLIFVFIDVHTSY